MKKQQYKKFLLVIIKFVTFMVLELKAANLVVNSDGLFQMEDGTTFDYCQDYKTALGDNAQNGFYKQTSQPAKKMYCLMDGQEWGLYSEYEIIFNRKKSESVMGFNIGWAQSKAGYGDDKQWWSGFDYIRSKCGQSNTCDMVFLMRTQYHSTNTVGGLYQKVFLNNWYINNEANNFSFTYSTLSAGQYISSWVANSFDYHKNQIFSTQDRNNLGNNCVNEYHCGWHKTCHYTNPFSPFGDNPPHTISFYGADDVETSTASHYDALDMIAFGISKINSGSQGINTLNDIGSINLNGFKVSCDHTVCATCSGSRTNCVLSCNDGCAVCDPTGQCRSCPGGKYLQQGECLQCDNTQCATCIGSNTNCILNCNQGCVTCFPDQTCDLCDNGKWSDNGICTGICDNTVCATCRTSATDCIKECNSDCKTCNIDGTCISCIDGTFLDNGQCKSCDNTQCATCENSSQECLTICNSTCKTCLPDQTCETCEDGKWLNIDQCDDCYNSVCGTCNTSATDCIVQCNSDCQTCNIDGTCKSCDDGKFLDNGQCKSCDNTKCATCQNTSQECILTCNSTCKTCLIDQTCDTCIDGKWLNSDQCDDCDYSVCGTCNTSATDCIVQCNSDCQTCNIDGTCKSCQDGQFLEGGQCKQCDNTKCATCENSSQECILTCNSTCKTCTVNQTCDSCNDGKWLNSNHCDDCNYAVCGTCNTSATDCIVQCNSDCQTCNIDGTCKSCQDGQFLEGGQCKQCDNTKCATCQNTSQECILTCNSTCQSCLVDQTCETCIDGKWLNSGICELCDIRVCGTCDTSPTDCIVSCQSDCVICNIDGSCMDPCPEFQYYEYNTQLCQNCQFDNCLCSQKEFCDECTGIDKEFRQLPDCQCKQGYFQNELGVCEQCSQSCITCSQKNECQICIQGNGRSLQPPQCGCQEQYYLDQNQNTCEKCPSQCQTCNDQKQCTLCIENQEGKTLKLPDCKETIENLLTTFISFSVDIQGNQIESQGICDKKCESCQLQSNNCTTCRIDSNRLNIPPNCECMQGYHDNQGQLYYCEKCNPMCLTCKNNYQCESCHQDDNRQLNPFDLTCVCQQGYSSENGSKKCEKCYYYQGKCVIKCPQNTLLDQKLQSCIFKEYKLQNQNQIILIIGIAVLFASFLIKIVFSYLSQRKLVVQQFNENQQVSIKNEKKYLEPEDNEK